MQDKENKDIIDSQGNVLKSTKDNRVKQFLKDNVWNILSTGLAACITLAKFKDFKIVLIKNFNSPEFEGIKIYKHVSLITLSELMQQ